VGSEPPSALHSQSELEQFFDLALDLLCIVGSDVYFKRVNPAYVRNLGYPGWELLSRPFFEFVHPDDVQSATDVMSVPTTPCGDEGIDRGAV
jgi:PAS domain S-box-containing protein